MKKGVSSKWLAGVLVIAMVLAGKSSGAVRDPEYKFRYITANEGLPQNTVDCMLKDKRGFMWFGTWNGMCRFDGYTFRIYQRASNAEGIPDNFIRALCEDHEGNIWVGTGKGLTRLNFEEDRFSIPGQIASSFASLSINHLSADQQNRIWIATEGQGLWLIHPSGNDLRAQKINDHNLPDRHTNYISLHDRWAFIGTDAGLAVLGIDNRLPDPAFEALIRTVGTLNITCIFIDSEENIWVGTDLGLYRYDQTGHQVDYFGTNPDDPSALDHLTVTAVAEDHEGRVIVGTLGGLNFFDRESRTFAHLSRDPGKNGNLNNPFVNSILADKQGNVWIGTDKGGINHYNIYQKPFFSLYHDPADPNSLSHNTVNSILKEKDALWVGTAGGGLNRITAGGRKVEHFSVNPGNPDALSSNFVSSVFRGQDQKLWIGTWGGGLNKLVSLKTGKFERYLHDSGNPRSINSDFVSSIAEPDQQRLLIGTRGGLDLFQQDEKAFLHIHEKMQLTEPLEVGCMLIDRERRLWVGSRNGLYRLKLDQLNQFDQQNQLDYDSFFNAAEDSSSLPGNYVISLYESRDGTLWIGTYGNGICRYEEDAAGKAGFVRYSEKDGLCNNVAYSIEEDFPGYLWISTDNGLSRFNPEERSFHNFYVRDGLLSDQFYWSASDTDEDGNIYFGGIAGLNYFNARDIDLFKESNRPVFTEFSVFNNPVHIGQKYHTRVILQQSVAETSELELSWKDAVFSIEFSALDYFLPEKIKYAYKMEGIDQDWVVIPATRRFANYTNLSGGDYIFRVKASNSDGVWSDNAAELKITIHPPFWKTGWFRILFVASVLILVMAYIRYRVSYLKKQKRKLEQQVRERTEKIEEQKEKLQQQAEHLQKTNEELAEHQMLVEGQKLELELQNSKIARQRDELVGLNEKVNLVNQLRLRFFTNISHEFRTPLTLIIDPLEQLMKNLKNDRNTINTLEIVNRNAHRLLHLINQLIYFRRIENGKMIIRAGRGDLKQFLRQIHGSFSDLARHQGMSYSFESDDPPGETWYDPEKLEHIFYNLLSNAFKYTPAQGRITMKVRFSSPFVCVEVTDTGKGIAEKHLPFIFERFYQIDPAKDNRMESSGIGLALTYELVQALHGRIEVESREGRGSCFRVLLPCTRDQFAEDEQDQTILPVEVNLEGRVDMLIQDLVYAEADPGPEETDGQKRSKPLILIIEDNYDLRTFLMKTLRSDYRTLGAENGKEGFSMAKKYSPDLIVSDVMMPVMDGIELCTQLKKDIQTSHIPVILLTARNMVENWIEGLETGADDYIPKPFNLELLQARLSNLIDSRRKLKKMFSSPAVASLSELTSSRADEEFLGRVYRILEANFNRDGFSANQLAAEMFVSHSLLYKKIKAITDLTVTDFLNAFKLRKAVALMQQKNLSVSEIAFQTGFNDPKYFSRIFRKFYGMSPTEFYLKS